MFIEVEEYLCSSQSDTLCKRFIRVSEIVALFDCTNTKGYYKHNTRIEMRRGESFSVRDKYEDIKKLIREQISTSQSL